MADSALIELLRDRRRLIENVVTIQTKRRGILPLKFNVAQQHYWQRRTLRDLIAKSRAHGFSTLLTAEFLTDAATIEGLNIYSIWPGEKQALEHMDAVLMPMYERLPEFITIGGKEVPFKPRAGISNRTTLTFPDLGSRITVGPAGSIKFARGKTNHRVHFSEPAFYPPGTFETLKAAAEGGAPIGIMKTSYGYEAPASRIIWESTANGRGGAWFDLVSSARYGRTGYALQFYPWLFDTEALIEEGSIEALEADRGALDYSVSELAFIASAKAIYNVDINAAQIRYRRLKQARLGDLFPQEMAEDLDTCFLTPLGMVISLECLERMRTDATRLPVRRTEMDGKLSIWQDSFPGEQYIVVADPSEGLWDNPKAAYSAAIVVRKSTWEEVARLYGKIAPREFADMLVDIAKSYNGAMIVPEINNKCGGEVIAELLNVKCYDNVYRQRDVATRAPSEWGWRTHRGNKNGMVQTAKRILEAGAFHTYDTELVGQLYNVVEDRGYYDAASGTFVDLAMCCFIAIAVLIESPPETHSKTTWLRRR